MSIFAAHLPQLSAMHHLVCSYMMLASSAYRLHDFKQITNFLIDHGYNLYHAKLKNVRMNDQTNERTNERTSERMNDRLNEQVNE